MNNEKRRIPDPLDTNIAQEVEQRETARMDENFRALLRAGIHEAEPDEPVPEAQKPADGPRELVIEEFETTGRRISKREKAQAEAKPAVVVPVVRASAGASASAPESEQSSYAGRAAAEQRSGSRAKRRQRRLLLTENAKIIVKDIIIACVLTLLLATFIRPTVVRETSMEPSIEPGDYLLMSRQAYRFGELERGDIVIFNSELKLDEDHNKLLIKRVIALPGDRISISGGTVYINGEALYEDYIAEGGTPGYVEEFTLKEGQIFVMGDHREVSVDSRSLGPIDEDCVVGRAVFRLWPLSGFGPLH